MPDPSAPTSAAGDQRGRPPVVRAGKARARDQEHARRGPPTASPDREVRPCRSSSRAPMTASDPRTDEQHAGDHEADASPGHRGQAPRQDDDDKTASDPGDHPQAMRSCPVEPSVSRGSDQPCRADVETTKRRPPRSATRTPTPVRASTRGRPTSSPSVGSPRADGLQASRGSWNSRTPRRGSALMARRQLRGQDGGQHGEDDADARPGVDRCEAGPCSCRPPRAPVPRPPLAPRRTAAGVAGWARAPAPPRPPARVASTATGRFRRATGYRGSGSATATTGSARRHRRPAPTRCTATTGSVRTRPPARRRRSARATTTGSARVGGGRGRVSSVANSAAEEGRSAGSLAIVWRIGVGDAAPRRPGRGGQAPRRCRCG